MLGEVGSSALPHLSFDQVRQLSHLVRRLVCRRLRLGGGGRTVYTCRQSGDDLCGGDQLPSPPPSWMITPTTAGDSDIVAR